VAENLQLEIVSPDKLVLSAEVHEVVAPGSEGQFGVLPGHLSLLATLDVGELHYKTGGTTGHVFINEGYAEVVGDKVTILAESAEMATDIDVSRAEASKQRAEERLSRAPKDVDTVDVARAEAALKRAIWRIRVAGGTH